MDRVILHCDLNNFYASVECLLNPSLVGKCVAVCGNAEDRHGIVLAKNTLAKNMGVVTGEAIWESQLKCPDLVVVPPNFEQYIGYSQMARNIYNNYTNQVEGFGMDECWLDLTNICSNKNGEATANAIRADIKQQLGLTISVGVSFNKVFAKLGSDLKKPDATTVISKENFKQIVYPLPVESLLMVGPKTTQTLHKLNIFTVGELALSNDNLLAEYLDSNGAKIKKYACGLDDDPVSINGLESAIKSVGHGTTTKIDMSNLTMAKQTIYALSELVATRLRRYKLKANVVQINIRFNDLSHRVHQTTLSSPTYTAGLIAETAYKLLKYIYNPNVDLAMRTITISTSKLICVNEIKQQLSIYDELPSKYEKIEETVDKIRTKYGYNTLTRAILLEETAMTDKYCSEEDLLPFKR
ncbi:MAG: DNA polymerase IV [Clostridia bacterium]